MIEIDKKRPLIAPSILSADFGRLAEEITDVERSGCDLIHVDVMDGHFVPNLTIGPPVIKWIRKTTCLPLDVHLMIDHPVRYVEEFKKAGSDWLTIHVEADPEAGGTLIQIKRLGMKAGMSLRPGTSIEKIFPYTAELDLVLIMTVEPGFGGQSFMPEMVEKVSALRSKFRGIISVDGGINSETAKPCLKAGADVLVAGTAVFGHKSRKEAIDGLRSSAGQLRQS